MTADGSMIVGRQECKIFVLDKHTGRPVWTVSDSSADVADRAAVGELLHNGVHKAMSVVVTFLVYLSNKFDVVHNILWLVHVSSPMDWTVASLVDNHLLECPWQSNTAC